VCCRHVIDHAECPLFVSASGEWDREDKCQQLRQTNFVQEGSAHDCHRTATGVTSCGTTMKLTNIDDMATDTRNKIKKLLL
jgi:hypothetical protein